MGVEDAAEGRADHEAVVGAAELGADPGAEDSKCECCHRTIAGQLLGGCWTVAVRLL